MPWAALYLILTQEWVLQNHKIIRTGGKREFHSVAQVELQPCTTFVACELLDGIGMEHHSADFTGLSLRFYLLLHFHQQLDSLRDIGNFAMLSFQVLNLRVNDMELKLSYRNL